MPTSAAAVTDVAEGWPFLVARGRRAGFRTILAPAFLVEQDRHHVLADSTGISAVGADGTGLVDVEDARVGLLSVGYTSKRVMRADVEAAGSDGGDLLMDEHGRPLEIVYGIVSRVALQAPLEQRDLACAQRDALQSYHRFLADEDGHRVETAAAFELRTAIRAGRPATVADRRPPVRPPSAPRWRRWRWRRGIVAAGAAAIGVMLVVAGTVLITASGTQQLTVYSSLPLEGTQGARSRDVIGGIRIALQEAGGRAGKFEVRYESLDDATVSAGAWAHEAVATNALRAAGDDSTAVYIGELNSAASAVSIPILSRAKVPQISPSNTAVGLTTGGPGADADEPGTYYARGFRNYVRIVPRDTIQGEAVASALRQDGCKRVALVHNLDRDGSGLARVLRRSIAAKGLRLVLNEPVTRSAASRRSLAANAARSRADCAVFSGDPTNETVMVVEALASALPRARLYGAAGLADGAFTDADLGGLPRRVAARMKLTLPTPGRDALGAAGRRFYETFAREHPDVRRPDPYAIYGYEAMRLALSAIARSGTAERKDIVKALFDTKDRRSVIGTYSIDASGDTTLTDHGLFAIRGGELVFDRTITTTG